MKYKPILAGAVILASAVLGDYCNVKDKFIEPVRYKNVKVDSGCYPKPFQLQKKYKINEAGRLDVYIGNSDKWCKVDKDLRVNERSIGEMLKEESKNLKPYAQGQIDNLIDWYEESFKDGNHN